MQKQNLFKIISAYLILSLLSLPALAIAPARHIDANMPIEIQSDTAFFEQLTRQATHEGNVIMKQGSHQLFADKLLIKKDGQGKDIVTAIGAPARFNGKLANDPDPVYATAKTIYYYPDKQLVVLEGSATLMHRTDKFNGPTLSYQLDKQIISAASQSNQRPTITIYPQVKQQ